MLLNYLFSHFLEEGAFAKTNDTSQDEIRALIDTSIFPAPSYVYKSNGHSASFVTTFTEDATYRFHLTGHSGWFETITRLGLTTECRARSHFFARYQAAKQAFLSSDLGQDLAQAAPDIPSQFDGDHANATWRHFLSGVYGVCTRDGQPESIFLKQAGVMFIEQMIAGGPGSLSGSQLARLERTVAFLDQVESDFAPHEAPQTSRQQCIVDVNAMFFVSVKGSPSNGEPFVAVI